MDVKCADVHPIYFCPSVLFFSRRTFVYSFSEQFCFSLHYGSRGQLRFTRERKITMLIINSAWVGLVSVRVMLVPRILLVKIYFHSQSPKHNRNSCLNFCTRKNNIYTKSLFVILFLKFNSIQSDITNKCLVSLYILWKDLYLSLLIFHQTESWRKEYLVLEIFNMIQIMVCVLKGYWWEILFFVASIASKGLWLVGCKLKKALKKKRNCKIVTLTWPHLVWPGNIQY